MSFTKSELAPDPCQCVCVSSLSLSGANPLLLPAENVYLPLPDVERGRGFVLNGDPKGRHFLYAHGKSIVVRDINVRDMCV